MKPPFPYYGGKQMLAEQIIRLLPDHLHYVEPYAGSLAVLFAKRPSQVETINDLDQELLTFWRVLRERPQELEDVCALTPHSRAEHALAFEPATDDLEVARRVFVRLTQGRMSRLTPTGWRNMVTATSGVAAMSTYLDGYRRRLAAAARRLRDVQLECRPALDVIRAYGVAESSLLYVDPPYPAETRNGTNYRHEMPHPDQHRDLAAALHECKAAVVVSGYACDLYDLELYPAWHRHEIRTGTGQGGRWEARTEVLWSNRPLGIQGDLLDMVGVA